MTSCDLNATADAEGAVPMDLGQSDTSAAHPSTPHLQKRVATLLERCGALSGASSAEDQPGLDKAKRGLIAELQDAQKQLSGGLT